MQPKLSLIIPVYNAELFISETLEKLLVWKNKFDFTSEIILVNDGSVDNTKTILSNFIEENKSFQLISYPENKGKGYAVKQGMLAAIGTIKIFTDADIPYGTAIFNQILNHLNSEKIDVCIGDRKSNKSDYHIKTSFIRKLSSKIFTFFIINITIKGLGDTQCGIKGFTEEASSALFPKLCVNGFAFDVEALYLSHKFNLNIKRIPVKFEGNSISTINLMSSSFRMFLDVLSLPIRYHILKKYSS